MWYTFVLHLSFNRRIQLKLTTVKFTQDVSHLFYLCCNSWVLTQVTFTLQKYYFRLYICRWRMCIHWWLMSPLVDVSSFPLNSINEHTQSRLSACLLIGVLYINQMYTVTYFEVNCEDRNPEVTQEFFTSYHEAKAYAKSFEEWDDVRVDYLQVNTEHVPFWTHMARLSTGLFHCVLY